MQGLKSIIKRELRKQGADVEVRPKNSLFLISLKQRYAALNASKNLNKLPFRKRITLMCVDYVTTVEQE